MADPAAAERRRRRIALLAGPALALVTTVFLVIVIEVVLHVLDYPPQQTSHQRLFIEYDSVRGWRNIANAEGEYITEEYAVRLRYNSRGVRGPEVPYTKPAGRFRVVMLGDSYVEGYMVPLEARVAEVLQQRLGHARAGADVDVIALGTAGYSTDQELLWLEQEGLRYQPDVVVVMFYANDVWYNAQSKYWRGGKPLFVVHDDSLALTNVPVPRHDLDDRQNEAGLRTFVEEHSKLYWLIAGAIKRVPRLHALAIRLGIAEIPPEMVLDAGDELPVPAEFNVYRVRETPEVALAWRTTQALLARMQRASHATGARFTAFMIPQRGDIYTHEAAIRPAGDRTSAGWDPEAVARRFRMVCAQERMDCIEPTERFRAEAARRGAAQRLYYRYDWHWNAAGHALAADILAERLAPRIAAP